jgi:glycosyltransferase involved in cell wall biosynthesis
MMDLSLVIPAYNEAGNLEEIVHQALGALPGLVSDFEVLVVDDGSTDGTSGLADRLAEKNERVRVVHHPHNLGYGQAQISGFRNARGELVALVPADNQFHIEDLARYLPLVKDADIVLGIRTRRQDTWLRKVVSRIFNFSMALIFGLRLKDINWVKLYKRRVLGAVDIECNGFAIDAEILVKAKSKGFRFAQVEVPHYPRRWGEPTGVNVRNILGTARELLWLWKKMRRVR